MIDGTTCCHCRRLAQQNVIFAGIVYISLTGIKIQSGAKNHTAVKPLLCHKTVDIFGVYN